MGSVRVWLAGEAVDGSVPHEREYRRGRSRSQGEADSGQATWWSNGEGTSSWRLATDSSRLRTAEQFEITDRDLKMNAATELVTV
jgi:hypothetical protein